METGLGYIPIFAKFSFLFRFDNYACGNLSPSLLSFVPLKAIILCYLLKMFLINNKVLFLAELRRECFGLLMEDKPLLVMYDDQ